jgi:hypothetical protein
MTLGGTNPAVTFPDGTIQNTAYVATGSVLQVVSANSATADTTTSTSFVTTSLSLSITPKFSTSKIVLFSTATIAMSTTNIAKFALARNGSNINAGSGGYGSVYLQAATNSGYPWANTYLDSPATTSATTYAVYFCADPSGGTVYFNSRSAGGAGTATLIAMEIAA